MTEVLRLACALADRLTLPTTFPSILKVTVPLGVPASGGASGAGVTVAVKVTDCPNVLGLTDETTVVVVLKNVPATAGPW
jgi:hypothetical protein